MATTNQKVVAEALRLARDVNFYSGLTFLNENLYNGVVNRKVTATWFADKCVEHSILSDRDANSIVGHFASENPVQISFTNTKGTQ